MIKLKSDISVIIPCFNCAATIKRAIKSVLSQTLKPLEILVCDDGSTDNTHAVVNSIRSPLVKWLNAKKHTGKPAVPRNKGLKKAGGKLLAFLDADDEWLPGNLEKQIAAAKKTRCLAVCSNAYRKINNKKQNKLYFNFPTKIFNLVNLLITNYVICSSMVIHRSLLKKTIGFSENNELISIEDYAFWLRIAAQTTIYYLDAPLVIYNDQFKTSIRSKVNKNPILLKMQVLKNFYEYLTHR